ncbi:helix-turn-helix domain-containing protein [Aquabacterium sp. J223]|uniref:helix-turn-helix domain-containing protein n=1 Tax=Aquabacterium sp. J223 TaxID=2898431 RepID=UPI0021AD681F|nr:helix-turn-helix domain-containing protein [Aquabacterium sp. J223]UUX97021.1 helix-turn-helix domain-containing protein [Aquabacterium sp. J223]
MSEVGQARPAADGATTAGAMLKAARQARGLHIAALAAAIKVTPAKLEALEEDRHDALPDATFARALAQTVCRALKIDAAPVLAQLPQASGRGLDSLGRAEAPLRSVSASRRDREAPAQWQQPMWWLAGLLVLGAVVLYLWPAGWTLDRLTASRKAPAAAAAATAEPSAAEPVAAPAPSTDAPSSPQPAPQPAALPVSPPPAVAAAAVPVAATAPASAPATTAAAVPLLQLRARGESWVQVQEVGSGRVLLSRLLADGEAPVLEGTPPFKVTIGNASVTELRFRGEPVRLPAGADSVARLELK